MEVTIPEPFKDLFAKVAFAHLATVMADGRPHVTPVWCSFDGTSVWVNSAKGRLKDKNMRRNKQVALSIQDPDNAYRYLAIQGLVTEITESGADAHIDALAKKIPRQRSLPQSRAGRGTGDLQDSSRKSFDDGLVGAGIDSRALPTVG
ncbi:MAG TPA: PPOX class F420-dependent oxidoreductase [Candidatus Limnocylindrales bacterium]|nr:PPOX class F420-dependent oxidoreductase [Candidatus Limnocylindrales bacterium]